MTKLKHWTRKEAEKLYNLPFNDLLFQAQVVHRKYFDPNQIQMSCLLSIKTGGCSEDCAYCNQSAHHKTGLAATKLIEVEQVMSKAEKARDAGATRYCMGAAWRKMKCRDMPAIEAMIKGVGDLGMETCMTLGMLTPDQALRLKKAGLDYYNHNIDTSEAYYARVVTTHTFAERLETLGNVRAAGIKVCAGGVVGMGEGVADRIGMLLVLANMETPPESVPINMLIAFPGTPLENANTIDTIDFIRTIAVARIMMPGSYVRLSAGRTNMSDECQALCYLAGGNSIFVGDTLLTTDNPGHDADMKLFARLGLHGERDDQMASSSGKGARPDADEPAAHNT